MAFSDGLAGIAKKIRDLTNLVEPGEATKSAFNVPFMSNILKNDVFDPAEVLPESAS